MRRLPQLLVLSMTLVSCGDDANPQRQRVEDECKVACEQALQLKCSAESNLTSQQCNARCLSIYDAEPKCQTPYLNLTECVAKESLSNSECNANGEADVVSTVCSSEYSSLETCMAGK